MIASDRIESLLTAIRGGSDLDTACHYASVSSAVVGRLLESGMIASQMISEGMEISKEQDEALALWEKVSKARADAVVRNVTLIQKAASEGSWQAAAWWLERAAPNSYGRQKNNNLESSQPTRQITGE